MARRNFLDATRGYFGSRGVRNNRLLNDPRRRRPGYGVRPMTGGPGGLSPTAQLGWQGQLGAFAPPSLSPEAPSYLTPPPGGGVNPFTSPPPRPPAMRAGTSPRQSAFTGPIRHDMMDGKLVEPLGGMVRGAPKQPGFFGRTGVPEMLGAVGQETSRVASQPGATFLGALSQGLGTASKAFTEAKRYEGEQAFKDRAEARIEEDRAREATERQRQLDLDAKRSEAYSQIFGEDGEFNEEEWDKALKTAFEFQDFSLAQVILQMKPQDPELAEPGEWKKGAEVLENGQLMQQWFRTNPDGTLEFETHGRLVGEGGAGKGGQGDKDYQTSQVALSAINDLVETGGAFALAGLVRDDAVYADLKGKFLTENKDREFTAAEIANATRAAWSDAEGYRIERDADGKLVPGDELAMMLKLIVDDPVGGGNENDWSITRYIKAKGKEFSQRNPNAVAMARAQAASLQAINPMVRYLSGAQMTNQEAMRYYGALIPQWGDGYETVNQKMRGLSLMAKAMAGDMEALQLVDMSGFVDDPALSPRQNKQARMAWMEMQSRQVIRRIENDDMIAATEAATATKNERDMRIDAALARVKQEEINQEFANPNQQKSNLRLSNDPDITVGQGTPREQVLVSVIDANGKKSRIPLSRAKVLGLR